MPSNNPIWSDLDLGKMASASGFDTTPEVADALLALAREQREVLKRVEWVLFNSRDQQDGCPVCYGRRNYRGHAPSCRLAALLRGNNE